jgi:hypothetical protein
MYAIILAVVLFGIGLGWYFGTEVFNSKLGTIIGTTLCISACAGLVWQLKLIVHDDNSWTPLRLALLALVLVMATCTAGSTSLRNKQPEATLRQGATMILGIIAVAMFYARFFGL